MALTLSLLLDNPVDTRYLSIKKINITNNETIFAPKRKSLRYQNFKGESLSNFEIFSNVQISFSGTIKRGKYPEKSLDIQLSVTPDHLSKLEKRVHDKYHDRCFCGLRRGPHVFILSVLSIPFMLIYSAWQAFFLGSMTWYNIFIYYNEERSCCHKLLSPLVLLFYPLWILPVTLGLGFFGAFRVISWYWDSWVAELGNPDSGFMAWACSKMNLPDCAPYAVVLLSADEDAYSADVTSLHRKCHPQNVWRTKKNSSKPTRKSHFDIIIIYATHEI